MSPDRFLVDAGPLVAIFNLRDHAHGACVGVLKEIRLPMLTTWMPVTEAMYLLDFSITAQGALLDMIERGVLEIADISARDLPAIQTLLDKYRDLPMDFADASLVHVANREGIRNIFTLDQRDFSVYRLDRGLPFEIVPKTVRRHR